MAELARKHDISPATYDQWKSKDDGLQEPLDNFPELISEALAKLSNKIGVKLLFIQAAPPPPQNGYIERVNQTYRQEVLNFYVFETSGEAHRMTED